jgi:hypothetical protein
MKQSGLNLVPFGRKFNTNSPADVKKIVLIVFQAEMFCFVLRTTSSAEETSIESSHMLSQNDDLLPVLIPSNYVLSISGACREASLIHRLGTFSNPLAAHAALIFECIF